MNRKILLFLLFVFFASFVEAQWVNSSWNSCRNININQSRTNEVLSVNITGLQGALPSKADLRIANAVCNGGGSFVNFQIRINASSYAEIDLINTGNLSNYSVYYNNSAASFGNVSLFTNQDTGECPFDNRCGAAASGNAMTSFGWTNINTLGNYGGGLRSLGWGDGEGSTATPTGQPSFMEVWMRDNISDSSFFHIRQAGGGACANSKQSVSFCNAFATCNNIQGWAVCVNGTYTQVMATGAPNSFMKVQYIKNGSFYDVFLTNQSTLSRVRVSQEIWGNNMEGFIIDTQTSSGGTNFFYDEMRIGETQFETFHDTGTLGISIGAETNFSSFVIMLNAPSNRSIIFFNDTGGFLFNYTINNTVGRTFDSRINVNGTVINTTRNGSTGIIVFNFTDFLGNFGGDIYQGLWNVTANDTFNAGASENQSTITIDVMPYNATIAITNFSEINDSANFNMSINFTSSYNRSRTWFGANCNLTIEGVNRPTTFDTSSNTYMVLTNSSTGVKTFTANCTHANTSQTVFSQNFNITDGTLPNVTVRAITNGTQTNSTNLTFSFTFSDNSSIIEANVTFNNTNFVINLTTGNVTVDNTGVLTLNSRHFWNVTAIDANNNRNTTISWLLIQDATAPALNSNSDPNSSIALSTEPFYVNVTDTNTIDLVQFVIQQPAGGFQTITMTTSNAAGFTHEGNYTFAIAGTYTLVNYTATDLATNRGTLSLNKSILVSASGGGGGQAEGGGGGAKEEPVVLGNVSVKTDKGTGVTDFFIRRGSSRTKSIFAINNGATTETVILSCEEVPASKGFCQYVEFSQNKLVLPPKKVETTTIYKVTVPEDLPEKEYQFRIKLSTEGGLQSFLLVTVKVSDTLGLIFGFIETIGQNIIFTNEIQLPFILLLLLTTIISLFGGIFILNNVIPPSRRKDTYVAIGGFLIAIAVFIITVFVVPLIFIVA